MADGHSRWVELMMGEIYPNHFDSGVSEPTDEYYLQWDETLNGGLGGTNWVLLTIPPADLVNDTTPQLGGALDLNSKPIITIFTAGESLVDGDLCYVGASSRMWKADASTETTCDTLLAICTETKSAGQNGTFVVFGIYATTGLSATTEYFVSTTAGEWVTSASKPSGVGEIVRHVGTAFGTTALWFNPSHTYIELV